MAAAEREKEAPKRAAAFEEALRATSLAWEKELYEHGLQLALDERRAKKERFGLTFDDSLLKRMDDLDWLAEAVAALGLRLGAASSSGPTGDDFTYASLRSFNEYDGVVKALRKRKHQDHRRDPGHGAMAEDADAGGLRRAREEHRPPL